MAGCLKKKNFEYSANKVYKSCKYLKERKIIIFN